MLTDLTSSRGTPAAFPFIIRLCTEAGTVTGIAIGIVHGRGGALMVRFCTWTAYGAGRWSASSSRCLDSVIETAGSRNSYKSLSGGSRWQTPADGENQRDGDGGERKGDRARVRRRKRRASNDGSDFDFEASKRGAAAVLLYRGSNARGLSRNTDEQRRKPAPRFAPLPTACS